MNNFPVPADFAVREGFDRAPRELERQQLIRLARGPKNGHRWRWLHTASATDLWKWLIARRNRIAGPAAEDSSDAQAWRADPTKLQEQCC